jgi:hypothetical protein
MSAPAVVVNSWFGGGPQVYRYKAFFEKLAAYGFQVRIFCVSVRLRAFISDVVCFFTVWLSPCVFACVRECAVFWCLVCVSHLLALTASFLLAFNQPLPPCPPPSPQSRNEQHEQQQRQQQQRNETKSRS